MSDFASHVVVTKKKDEISRVCADYRYINWKTVKDRHPIPLIDEQLDKLQDAMIFWTLDLKNGFFYVAVEEKSRQYLAFVTHKGSTSFGKYHLGFAILYSYFNVTSTLFFVTP